MTSPTARQRSLYVYHLYMGGPDSAALEWRALRSARFLPRLMHMGVVHVDTPSEADIVVVTGLLTTKNLDLVLDTLSQVPAPVAVIAAGDEAVNGGNWLKMGGLQGLEQHPISHYVEVHVTVPGDPPTPQALIAALAAAAQIIGRPVETLPTWQEDE